MEFNLNTKLFGYRFNVLEDILNCEFIDKEIRELVYLFNKYGMITDGSCYGHKDNEQCTIVFSESVDDDIVFELIPSTPCFSGDFYKWARKTGGKILFNWIYETNNEYFCIDGCKSSFKEIKDSQINRMIELLKSKLDNLST